MKNKKILITVAAISFLFSLILLLPAQLIVSQVDSKLPAQITINQINGNVWQGDITADLNIAKMDENGNAIDSPTFNLNIEWQFELASVFKLKPAFELSIVSSTSKVDATLYPGLVMTGGEVHDLLIDSPLIMTLFEQYLPQNTTAQTDGTITGNQIKFNAPNNGSIPLSLSGNIEWTGGNVQYQFGNAKGGSVLPKSYGFIRNNAEQLDISFELLDEQGDQLLNAMLNQPTVDDIATGKGEIRMMYEVKKLIVPYVNSPILSSMYPKDFSFENIVEGDELLGKLEVSQ